jgi:catechol 2,3-dioxygenase-like lactoylglutathione lyase family enzyme
VDIVVDDLEAATAEFENFLAIRSVPATEDRGLGLRGVDFPIGGLDAMGLLALDGSERGQIADSVASFRSASGEGPMILGFHVDDLDRVQRDLQDLGVKFLCPSPIRTGEGRSNFTRPVYGVTFEFTES